MRKIKSFKQFESLFTPHNEAVKKEEVFTKKEIDNLPEEVLDGMTSHTCPKCNGKYKSPCDLCEGQGSIFYRDNRDTI